MPLSLPFEAKAVSVGTDETTLGAWNLQGDGSHIINFEIQNNDSAVPGGHLDSFTLQLKDHKDGEFYDYLADADWESTTNENLRAVSQSVSTEKYPHSLEDNVKTHVSVRINAAKAFRLLAKSDTAATSVTVLGNVCRE